jgi:hypothetical protein
MAMFLTLVPAGGGPPELAARGQARVRARAALSVSTTISSAIDWQDVGRIDRNRSKPTFNTETPSSVETQDNSA